MGATTRDPELERFKTVIDLRVYASEEYGYVLDRRESWRGSSVMRHEGTGGKIVIKRDGDGHYVYFSARDDADNGSIIDFVQKRRSCTLGQVRMALRPWVSRAPGAIEDYAPLPKTPKDRVEMERRYRGMRDAMRHPYLEGVRGLSPALLGSLRFAGRVKIDGKGNAVFPHFDADGLSGYEMKNAGFTGFSGGGRKGLWQSNHEGGDKRLVIAEGAIDALSYAQQHPDGQTRYASLGGQLSAIQPVLIQEAVRELAFGSEVVAAMDADAAGERLAVQVGQAVVATGRKDLSFRIHAPAPAEGVKDWNDALRADVRRTSDPSFPAAHF